MTGLTTRRFLATGALVAVLWGCGGQAAGSPAAATSQSSAAQSSAASSAAVASDAAPSSAASSDAAPSFAIPSFELPSGAKDLEALLPDTLCGVKAVKLSMSGAQFSATADKEFLATLQALGKQPSDVAFAVAGSQTCSAGIFRIAGVDSSLFKTTFLAEEQKTGSAYTQGSVGGRDVFIGAASGGGGKQYVYFKGDAAIFVQATKDADAASILATLP